MEEEINLILVTFFLKTFYRFFFLLFVQNWINLDGEAKKKEKKKKRHIDLESSEEK